METRLALSLVKDLVLMEYCGPWRQRPLSGLNLRVHGKRTSQRTLTLRETGTINWLEDLRIGAVWVVTPLYVEIGARGAIHEHSWSWMCRRLGIWGKARQRLRTAVQDTAICCSHFLFINRFQKIWERKPLLYCGKASKGALEK